MSDKRNPTSEVESFVYDLMHEAMNTTLERINERVTELEMFVDDAGLILASPEVARMSDDELKHAVGLFIAYRAWFETIKELPIAAFERALRDADEHNERTRAQLTPKQTEFPV